MSVIVELLAFVVFLFLLTMFGRLIFDWIQAFARDWRPSGPILVVAEGVYSVTDPPLKALRRVIPPLRLGAIRIDLAFTVLFILVFILWNLLRA